MQNLLSPSATGHCGIQYERYVRSMVACLGGLDYCGAEWTTLMSGGWLALTSDFSSDYSIEQYTLPPSYHGHLLLRFLSKSDVNSFLPTFNRSHMLTLRQVCGMSGVVASKLRQNKVSKRGSGIG